MKKANGFTIVELLVVIVVIAILATITIVSYNFVRKDAQNARRISDMKTITDALELYRLKNNSYPDRNPNLSCREGGSSSGWEDSSRCPDEFLSALQPYIKGKTPVDPKNSSQNTYQYARYSNGYYSCDPRGEYYVLRIIGRSDEPVIESSPGWSCPGRNWTTESNVKWVTGDYIN